MTEKKNHLGIQYVSFFFFFNILMNGLYSIGGVYKKGANNQKKIDLFCKSFSFIFLNKLTSVRRCGANSDTSSEVTHAKNQFSKIWYLACVTLLEVSDPGPAIPTLFIKGSKLSQTFSVCHVVTTAAHFNIYMECAVASSYFSLFFF